MKLNGLFIGNNKRMSDAEEWDGWWIAFQPKSCPKDCCIIGCNNPECPRMINSALLAFEPRISEATGLRIIDRIMKRLFRVF
jgi:hypothetical protein